MSEQASRRGFLLDTHVAIMAIFESRKLSAAAKTAIAEGPNLLSVVVYWEVMLKSMKGKLDVGDPHTWWREMLDELAATPMPIRPQHVGPLKGLPFIHSDPFDRMLIAQAMTENLILVSNDAKIMRYASSALTVIA